MKYLIKFIILFLFSQASVAEESFGVISIMYHRVGEPKYPSTNISPEVFKEHLKMIESSKIPFMTPEEFKQYILEKKKLEQKKILLTFDDAFLSFYKNGWPLLKEKKIPFILFVNTREINQKHFNYMNWDQIREIHQSGLGVIGGHSFSHGYFTETSIAGIEKDIQQSQADYKRELGTISNLYAHTFGETSLEITQLLKKYGYDIQFGQHSGVISLNENIFYLPRFSLNENYGTIKRFKEILQSKAFHLKLYEPKTILLKKENNPPKMKLVFDENVKGINCFDDAGGNWKKTKVNFLNNQEIELDFEKPFVPRRGRLNCTLPSKGSIKWFGYQYSVLN